MVRAKRPERLPVVFTCEEVRAVLSRLEGDKQLMAGLLFGKEGFGQVYLSFALERNYPNAALELG